MKSEGWAPLKTYRLMKNVGSKKCQICLGQMKKKLVHSFYYILYQPKGVLTPRDNFSGTGGSLQGLLWKSFQHNKYCPNPFNLNKIVFADYFSCFHFFWIKSIHSKRKTCPYIFVTPFFGLKPKVLCIIIYFVIYLYYPKIQQTKMHVTCQRFGDLFLFGLVWQYSSVQTKYNKGRFKVMTTYLHQ